MITFNQLLRYYPTVTQPCDDRWGSTLAYSNQCAIRMSIALLGCDPHFLDAFNGNRCSHRHARGARALARYLRDHLAEPSIYTSRSQARGQGIIFYLREPKMNHIDIWTTIMTLPRIGPGNAQTMTWTATDASEYWFWPLQG